MKDLVHSKDLNELKDLDDSKDAGDPKISMIQRSTVKQIMSMI